MKSELRPKEKTTKNEYPCLRMHHSGEFIVLFTEERTGMVVWVKDNAVNRFGEYTSCWTNAYDRSMWRPYEGEVVLSS